LLTASVKRAFASADTMGAFINFLLSFRCYVSPLQSQGV
jgi:hypothetical protein